MDSEGRRQNMMQILKDETEPVSGTRFAELFGVTRQVIVKDISILKASGQKILSTARGYLLEQGADRLKKRKISVCHKKEDIEKELQIIVDLGGNILQTYIEHPVYGVVEKDLHIKNRRDISSFLDITKETGCMPLLELTKGKHAHIIAAESEAILDEICIALKQAKFLLED